jgi:hypothetical protein
LELLLLEEQSQATTQYQLRPDILILDKIQGIKTLDINNMTPVIKTRGIKTLDTIKMHDRLILDIKNKILDMILGINRIQGKTQELKDQTLDINDHLLIGNLLKMKNDINLLNHLQKSNIFSSIV